MNKSGAVQQRKKGKGIVIAIDSVGNVNYFV